jgi:glycine/D-amino acid oxidase-like deaminating enzyme
MDQDELPINRASLRNEGKIHLGLLYANDPTLESARLQLTGALRFRRLLERWIGESANQLRTSTPFLYAVAHDSVLGPDALEDFYARLNQEYGAQCRADPELDYLGTRPETLAQRLDAIPREFAGDSLQAVFATAELAIDPEQLAHAIRGALFASPLIRFYGGRRVRHIERSVDLLRVEGDGPDGCFAVSASQVVNATWEGRAVLDRGMGLPPPPGLLHRLKYRVLVQVPEAMQHGPSVTMVLGRYGDVVIRPEGLTFLSWYPAGLQGWTNDIEPPPAWNEPCRGNPPPDLAREISALILRSIDEWYPGIANSRVAVVDAGAIVARGRTDVDDANSDLHDRTRVGVTSVDNYHTVDPGKLTTAPLFALQAAERVALRAGQSGESAAFGAGSLNS